jgi:predicted lipid-binding transport protein (Tim44 family)
MSSRRTPTPEELRRRRAMSARVRRRRMLVSDLGAGILLALIALLLASGLAVAALGAIIVLALCAAWVLAERRGARPRRRRPRRNATAPRERAGEGTEGRLQQTDAARRATVESSTRVSYRREERR